MQGDHVVVLFNAPSLPADHPDYVSEAGVLEAVEAVTGAMVKAGHRISEVVVDGACEPLCARLALLRPDVVFNLFEGFEGRGHGQAQVAGIIEALGFALTGASSTSLALAQNKARCHWLLRGAGVATPDFCYLPRGEAADAEALDRLLAGGAVIVKPAAEDASLGVSDESVTDSVDQVRRQAALLADRYGDVIVERFLDGREFNVAIVGWPGPRVLPLAEIVFDRRLAARERLVTYDAKWSPASAADLATPVHCPADVDADLAGRIRDCALAAYKITACRDYARIDIRIDERGRPCVLDVNNNCDLAPRAGLDRAVRAAGQSYEEFIVELAAGARRRGAVCS